MGVKFPFAPSDSPISPKQNIYVRPAPGAKNWGSMCPAKTTTTTQVKARLLSIIFIYKFWFKNLIILVISYLLTKTK